MNNFDEMLTDTSSLSSNFEGFTSFIEFSNDALIQKYISNKNDISSRLDILTKIRSGMDTNGFSASIFSSLGERRISLSSLTEKLTSINSDNLNLDNALNNLIEIENDLYSDIIFYKNIGITIQQIKIKLDSLMSTPTNAEYLKLKPIYDYFSSKTKILEDFSSSSGIASFNTNIGEIEKVTIDGETIKNNIKVKIDALLELDLTTNTAIETALTSFKSDLDVASANVDEIKTSLNTKVKEIINNNMEFNDIWWDWSHNDDLQTLPVEKHYDLIGKVIEELKK